MSYEEAMTAVRQYVADRDWSNFHTPENLAKSISIEAGELLELFQWSSTVDEAALADELADVLTYSYLLADRLGLDPNKLVSDKAVVTERKYPVKKSFGRSDKYDRL
ncbi:MAG: nucleotide pyrophosphohydrolase [Brevibacterium aurantiacum]|uniref:nucleotide pyrophosphohydrolase n=1 Tax=Brevibacterium TaxID=1696 RepID=UPI000C77F6B0|nr:nucleotide pyrophosphohydrolase [Brevibacterium sp. Mu109]